MYVVYYFCFLRATILETWRLWQRNDKTFAVHVHLSRLLGGAFAGELLKKKQWCAGSIRSLQNLAKKLWYFLDFCVSSMHWGHANLLCIVPILSDARRRKEERIDGIYTTPCPFFINRTWSCTRTQHSSSVKPMLYGNSRIRRIWNQTSHLHMLKRLASYPAAAWIAQIFRRQYSR